MLLKKVILHLTIRIGILILLFGLVFLFWHFTYDPHKFCEEDEHRHVDGGLGFFIILFIITQLFYFGLLIEMIYLFVKKNKALALANLGFLAFSLLIVLSYMFLID